jgi:hypothetical protein
MDFLWAVLWAREGRERCGVPGNIRIALIWVQLFLLHFIDPFFSEFSVLPIRLSASIGRLAIQEGLNAGSPFANTANGFLSRYPAPTETRTTILEPYRQSRRYREDFSIHKLLWSRNCDMVK